MKPSGVTEEQIRRFGELLSAALLKQQRLSEQTPYVLAPAGTLIETEQTFEFEHEPAAGLPIPELFDPDATPLSVEQLTQATCGLVYGLRAAHGSATVHGGICPGTVVRDPAGVWKLTDFGFAPAVLAAFESDAFINLAVGRSTAQPEASAVWEILADPEEPRDERLWSFVDPDRYLQAINAGKRQPARFVPISDVISAGFVLYILADRVHPYLKSIGAAEEFRIASYWDMLHTGRPRDIARKDLLADPQSALYDWWKNFVPRAIERKPEARKTIEELAVRLETLAPPIDATQLLEARRLAESRKWMSMLDARMADADWKGVEQLLGAAPTLPPDLQTRVASARSALDAHKKARADAERERAELADWTAWLDNIQTRVDSSDWDAAADLLKQRRDRGLAACPELQRGRWQALTAAVRTAREERDRGLELTARAERARAWIAQMRSAAEAGDVARSLSLATNAPDTAGIDADLVEEVDSLAKWAAEVRAAIDADHAAAQAWLAKAEGEAARRRWREAIELLDQPPELSHQPDDLEARVDRLRTTWAQRLASLGDERRAAAEALVHGLVAECAKRRLAEFVQPEAIDTIVKSVSDEDVDGASKTRVAFTVAWHRSGDRDTSPMGEFNCVIGFEGAEPRLLSDAAELTGAITAALTVGIAAAQDGALTRWVDALKGTFLAGAEPTAQLQTVVANLPVDLHWKRGAIEVAGVVPLEWDSRLLAWRSPRDAAPPADIVTQAVAHASNAILQALQEKLPAISQWRSMLAVAPIKPPTLKWESLPPTLQFNTQALIRPPEGQPETLAQVQVVMAGPVDTEVRIDARALKTAVESLLLKQRKASIAALGSELQARIKKTAASIKTGPDPKSATAATWVLGLKGGEPLKLTADWKNEVLAFAFPADWRKIVDDYLNKAVTAPAAAPPAQSPTPPSPGKPTTPDAPPIKPVSPTVDAPTAPPPAKAARPESAPSREKPAASPKPAAAEATPPPRFRRAQLGIGAAAVVALASLIGWLVFKPKPPSPGPSPDPRMADVTNWFDAWSNAPEAARTDAWFAQLEAALAGSLPEKPGGMPDYDTRVNELRLLVDRHRAAKAAPDPQAARLTTWRGMIDEANRLIAGGQLDEAQRVLGEQMGRDAVPAELRAAVTGLETAIAAARSRQTPVPTTDPTTLPARPAWPEDWEQGLTVRRMVMELIPELWLADYAAVVPDNAVPPNALTALPDDKFRIAISDAGIGLPALTGSIVRSGNLPISAALDSDSQRALIDWLAKRVLPVIESPLAEGNLSAVYKWKQRLAADRLFTSTLLENTLTQRTQALAAAIPNAWVDNPAFIAGPPDAQCGYPTTLTETAGDKRQYKLHWTRPGDTALWSLAETVIRTAAGAGRRDLELAIAAGANPVDKSIRIFYLETTVSGTAPPPAAMPRLAEWFIAAARDSAVRNGAKTWCADGWACGSAELTLSGNRRVRIPELPGADGAVAAWLANPLTCQRRDPAEVLDPPIAGYRRILRFWPEP